MIDPQLQANTWVRKSKGEKLLVLRLSQRLGAISDSNETINHIYMISNTYIYIYVCVYMVYIALSFSYGYISLHLFIYVYNIESAYAHALSALRNNYARKLEVGISQGSSVLIENVPEVLDPLLEPLLQKAKFKAGNMIMSLGAR